MEKKSKREDSQIILSYISKPESDSRFIKRKLLMRGEEYICYADP